MHENLAVMIFSHLLPGRNPKKVPRVFSEIHPYHVVKFFFVSKYQKDISKFFYEMVTRWLIPGKQLDPVFYFFTKYKEYAVAELAIQLLTKKEINIAKQNIAFLEKEILMGLHSFFYAKKILEIKGYTLDQKISVIRDKISLFLHRFPTYFDYDIFEEMQHLFLTTKEEFQTTRQANEIGRIICILYVFRKILEKKYMKNRMKRHVYVKLKKNLLSVPFGFKEILSIFVGFNFLREYEIFEERHFLAALKGYIPSVASVSGSYFSIKKDHLYRFYLEVEKKDHSPFSFSEIKELKEKLPGAIRGKIEQLVSPVFMPRNEEEILRNILILSKQLKFVRDIPQMVISFNEQDDKKLSFTVVLVRILHNTSISIQELFDTSTFAGNFSIDRIKIVGKIRKKYPKEATVMQVHLSRALFLREDFSVDLFHARLHLACEIEKILGEVRDYNGGMISKQGENFNALKKQLGTVGKKNSLLLQNFFHAISPVHFSTTCDPKLLKTLFEMFLEMIELSKENFSFTSKKAKGCLFVLVKSQDVDFKQKILHQIDALGFSLHTCLSVQMQVFDALYFGFILLCSSQKKHKSFLNLFHKNGHGNGVALIS